MFVPETSAGWVGEGMVKSLIISDNLRNSCIGKGGKRCKQVIDHIYGVVDA